MGKTSGRKRQSAKEQQCRLTFTELFLKLNMLVLEQCLWSMGGVCAGKQAGIFLLTEE